MNSHAKVWREASVVALALAGLVAALLWLANGWVLLTRPFWVDEIHTVLVASRRSPAAIVADLAAGADYGPPLLHLLMWVVRAALGDLTPVAARAVSLVSVLAALALAYAVLRRVFGREASFAGALAVGSAPLVLTHAFEGRYYGPWLLCAAFFAWALPRDSGARSARMQPVLLAFAAVLLCLVHWYGVITMTLMGTAALASRGRAWRRGLRELSPALAGVLALLACVPLVLGQRAALTSGTWVPDLSWGAFVALARLHWAPSALKLAVAAWLLVALARRAFRTPDASRSVSVAIREPAIAALLASAAMPLVLVGLSVAGQPSMIARYGIVATLAWAPLVALVATAIGRWPTRLVALALAALWYVGLEREAAARLAFQRQVATDLDALSRARRTGAPVVFQSMHTLYAAAWRLPPGERALAYVELPDTLVSGLFGPGSRFSQLNKGVAIERDVVRVHARRFGFPALLPHAVLDTARRFVLLTSAETLPRGWFSGDSLAKALFPGHAVSAIGTGLSLVERPD